MGSSASCNKTSIAGAQTTGIDPSKESAVGHGHVICFSVYCRHPEVDFRRPGTDGPRQGRLWVDTMQTDEVSLSFPGSCLNGCVQACG